MRAASQGEGLPDDVLYAYLRSIWQGVRHQDGAGIQDASHGRSDITARPFSAQRLPALIFKIKSVAPHLKRNGKRSLKTAEQMRKDLENVKIEALGQLADLRYRERVPRHATKVQKFAFVFCGKFCVAAVRTLQRNSMENWGEVAVDSTVVSESMTEMGDEDVGDEDEEV